MVNPNHIGSSEDYEEPINWQQSAESETPYGWKAIEAGKEASPIDDYSIETGPGQGSWSTLSAMSQGASPAEAQEIDMGLEGPVVDPTLSNEEWFAEHKRLLDEHLETHGWGVNSDLFVPGETSPGHEVSGESWYW